MWFKPTSGLMLRLGVLPVELQRVAEEEKLVWPVGHFFQYTEFRI